MVRWHQTSDVQLHIGESRDSGFDAEPVIGPARGRTRWHRPGNDDRGEINREPAMTHADTVLVERDGPVTIVSITRPHCRNAVDGATARKLFDAFLAFDAAAEASVAVFTGTGGYFCAGADLKAVAAGDPNKKRELGGHDSIAPMGPSRLRLTKPVISAGGGFSGAGGMGVALWADMPAVARGAPLRIFFPPFWRPA